MVGCAPLPQCNRKDHDGYPSVAPKPWTKLLIFPCHIADAVWVPKLGCQQFECSAFAGQLVAHQANSFRETLIHPLLLRRCLKPLTNPDLNFC